MATSESEGEAWTDETPVISPTKKKKKKEKGSSTEASSKKSKKSSSKKKEKDDSTGEGKKKKKKKSSGASVDLDGSEASLQADPAGEEIISSPPKEKKSKRKSESKGIEDNNASVPNMSGSFSDIMSPSKVKKHTPEYFESVLVDVRERCERKIKMKSADRDKFLDACGTFYETWLGKYENVQWLHELEENKGSEEEIQEAMGYVEQSNAALPKMKTKCIKAALKVFDQLDEKKLEALEDKLVKGAIIAQAGAEELAGFSEKAKENEKLIKKLFMDAELMRDMLRFGGPAKYKYGNAMKIYTECVKTMDGGDLDSKWERVNKKIALACALEFAAGLREFDSVVEIDPIKRYKHFEEAHRKGELDPAFPHFSVWEMRQIVNCDAPNDQMKWIRDTVMNYVPHITFITDLKLRYTYILQSDVRVRKPTWTNKSGDPRTYPMILSGGGNQTINSWFARFLLKSFGLPAWGAKERKFEGFCRWTAEGWEAMNGATWKTCSWQGKTGEDFKTELEARNKAPQQEYWKKLVMLQALADVVDGDPNAIPDYELDVLHPERLWRSLSIISMELLFQTEPEVERTFERKGRSLVTTRNEKYLEIYELDKPDAEISVADGVVTIPAGRHGFTSGNVMVIDSFSGGKQVNFIADGAVEYELPDDAPEKKYDVTIEVCTVSSKQSPLTIRVNDSDDQVTNLKIPYTEGKWQTSSSVAIDLKGGSLLRFIRPKGSMGLAIKKITLT